MLLVDFGTNQGCLRADKKDDGSCANPGRYFYVPVNVLMQDVPPNYVSDTLTLAIRGAGNYNEHCDNPSAIGNGGNGTAPPTNLDQSYKPTLTCPRNLGVRSGCSVGADDYLGASSISGDTEAWVQKGVSYVQSPGPGTNVSYGQQYITFNASTPYQTTTCTSLLQVVPPFSATFSPMAQTLAYPQDGSDLIGASYLVGYVASCDEGQYGACNVRNITSANTPGFTWKRTSPQGNPLQTFNFGNGGKGWPEFDQLTFTIACTDVYGSNGGVETYQRAFRNDIKTETLTLKTATITFNSATKYLSTSIKTFYTSVVTPLVTVDLNTATVYTRTSYTGTQTLTQYGAASNTGTTTSTRTVVTVPTTARVTQRTTVTPTPATTTLRATIANTTLQRVTTTLPRVTSTIRLNATVTTTKTETLCGAIVTARALAPEERAIQTTTTVTDASRTVTVTDFANTATTTKAGTTVSTNYNDWATTTLQRTSTVYDPFDTTYVSTILYAASTRVIAAFTDFSTRTFTTVRTSTATTTTTSVSSIPQRNVTTTIVTGAAPTTTIRVTPTPATVSVNATTLYRTVTRTKTITCTITP